jgi:EF hand domain-containing protein
MLFALGAASSAIDLLSSLMSSKSTTQTGSSGQGSQTTGLFAPSTGTSTSTGSSTGTGSGSGSAQISPLTMGALISAQSQSQTAVSNSPTAASRSDALKDLFSQIDADGNGKITQSEFENALGAGGTNTAQADDVFSKLDSNGDGSVSLDEMSQALQSHKGGGHHRHHMATGNVGDQQRRLHHHDDDLCRRLEGGDDDASRILRDPQRGLVLQYRRAADPAPGEGDLRAELRCDLGQRVTHYAI